MIFSRCFIKFTNCIYLLYFKKKYISIHRLNSNPIKQKMPREIFFKIRYFIEVVLLLLLFTDTN